MRQSPLLPLTCPLAKASDSLGPCAELKRCLVDLLGHQNKGVKELAAAALPRVLQEVSVGLEDGTGNEGLYREAQPLRNPSLAPS